MKKLRNPGGIESWHDDADAAFYLHDPSQVGWTLLEDAPDADVAPAPAPAVEPIIEPQPEPQPVAAAIQEEAAPFVPEADEAPVKKAPAPKSKQRK